MYFTGDIGSVASILESETTSEFLGNVAANVLNGLVSQGLAEAIWPVTYSEAACGEGDAGNWLEGRVNVIAERISVDCPTGLNPALWTNFSNQAPKDNTAATDNTAMVVNIVSRLLLERDVAGGGSDADTDGDGVADSVDNCTAVANADQRDSDGDGYGNLCDGDLDNDGETNTLDLNLYRQAHRSRAGDPNYNPDADFNGDGQVNTLDLSIYKGLHRRAPGPSAVAR
jgi:hypothetical protein